MTLWRLAALNPAISPTQREDLEVQLKDWHVKTIDRVRKARTSVAGVTSLGSSSANNNNNIRRADIESFSGFKPGIDACRLNWDDYVIAGVTYVDRYPLQWHFSFGRQQEGYCNSSSQDNATASSSGTSAGSSAVDARKGARPRVSQVSGCTMAPLDRPLAHLYHNHIKSQEFAGNSNAHPHDAGSRAKASAAAKHDVSDGSSSEGFCESDRRGSKDRLHDSDSDLGADIADVTAGATAVDVTSDARKTCATGKPDNVLSPVASASSSSSSSSKTLVVNTSTTHPAAGTSVLQVPAHVKVISSDDLVDDDGSPILGAMAAVTSAAPTNPSSKSAQAPSNPEATSRAAGGSAVTSQAAAGVSRQASLADSQPSTDDFSVSVTQSVLLFIWSTRCTCTRVVQMYFYDTQACKSQDLNGSSAASKKKDEPNYFAGLKKSDTAQDVSSSKKN